MRELEQVARELRERIAALQAELDKSTPNMRAIEQFDVVKEREKEQVGGWYNRQ